MGKIYPYTLLPGLESTGVLAPMIPVTYRNGKYSFNSIALVDSGAQGGIISTPIADDLHLDWRSIPVQLGFGMGSKFRCHSIENLEIEIDDENFMINIDVVEGVNAFNCILGRNDIFKKAEIIFRGYKSEFELSFRDFN